MKIPGIVYTSPEKFSLGQRAALAIMPRAVASALYGLFKTCRWDIRNHAILKDLERSGRHVLLAFWHESMGMAGYHYRGSGYHTLTSYSYDGEIAARVVACFGIHAVRGSSSRGGGMAVEQLTEVLRHATVGFTLDGPRGPRREAKPGIAVLSVRAGVPVLPVAFAPVRCKRLHSWDQFPVPHPFSRIICAYAPPIEPTTDTSREGIEAFRQHIETELNALHASIET